MVKALIIVESPSKMKTLRKFLGAKYTFESSVGHIRDLPERKFGIDIEHNFEPQYEILEGKKEVVEKLKKAAKQCDVVYLSPDPDREGEAIAWHIAAILPKGVDYKRVTFNEYTKDAVLEALKHPRDIDESLVNAQQARRLLDRIVGYKISPILHRKIHRGHKLGSLSAGRVQSVALKLVVDREKEIEAFVPVEYWNLGSFLTKQDKKQNFQANLYSVNGKKVDKEKKDGEDIFLIPNEKTAKEIQAKLEKATYKIAKVEKKEKKRNPVPPFITSTLQQEASRHYGLSATKTMSIAQSLYEGVDLGQEGTEGLITYMRTDSVRVSAEAANLARAHIKSKYGEQYLPPQPPIYSSKKSSQDAHEAIRPTNFNNTPDKLKDYLTKDQHRLYLLIWQRFMASQMKPAIYDTVSADIATNQNLILRTTGSIIKFPGFLIAYEEKSDIDEEKREEDAEKVLPDLKEGEPLFLKEVFVHQSFTKPPPRFTEASLIKELEKSGVGRPSTYATIMQKIQGRSYTVKEKSALKPTELGRIICQMLEENFPKIMNVKFTAEMEDYFDKIAETNMDWRSFIENFWKDFIPSVEMAEKEARVPKITTDIVCPECKKGTLQKIWARDKYFYGCSTYPDCKYTAPLDELTYNKEDYAEDFDWEQKCPKCGSEMKVRKSRFGIFLGCSTYPECKTIINIPKKGEKQIENLPHCPAVGCPGQIVQRRSRFGKTFFSCSTFPDCDVIANSLEDLDEKYKDHPRTAYEGKKKGAKGAKATGKNGKGEPKEKKTRLQALYRPSPALEAIIGKGELTRQDVTKKLWDYIKKHKLQDPANKRKIVPDKKLAAFLGHSESIDMMKLAGYISKHLITTK